MIVAALDFDEVKKIGSDFVKLPTFEHETFQLLYPNTRQPSHLPLSFSLLDVLIGCLC
jgi:hypothetical protein